MQKQPIPTFSAYEFSSPEDIKFSLEEYSLMKHGSVPMGRKFGIELAQGIFNSPFRDQLLSKQIVVIGAAAYSFIRCAASMIMDAFIDELNILLDENGAVGVQKLITSRALPFITDYAKMDKNSRVAYLKDYPFTFDHEFAKDKLLLILDDVFITGGNYIMVEEMLDRYKIPTSDAICIYYAKLRETSSADPSIESYINNHKVCSLDGLLEILMGEHEIVARQLKLILTCEDYSDLMLFFSQLPTSIIRSIYNGCIGEGYHREPSYMLNFGLLKDVYLKSVSSRKHVPSYITNSI